MKFFADTADTEEIRELADLGLLDGVTTNPSLVAKTGRDFFEVLKEICSIVDGPVSAEVTATDYDSMITEGRKLAEVADNITSAGGALRTRTIIAAAANSDDVATQVHTMWAGRMAATRVIVERAMERGDIAPETDPVLVIESLVAPIWLRLLVTGETVDDQFVDDLAAFTARAAASGQSPPGGR